MTDSDDYIAYQLAFIMQIMVALTAGAFLFAHGSSFFTFLHEHNPTLIDVFSKEEDEEDEKAEAVAPYVSPLTLYANKYRSKYDAAPDAFVFTLDELNNAHGCEKTAEKKRRQELLRSYVSDNTPTGTLFMRYNDTRNAFEYYGSASTPSVVLESLARKYVLTFRCKPVFVSGRPIDAEKQKAEEEREKKEKEKERGKAGPPRMRLQAARGQGQVQAPPERCRAAAPLIKDTVAANIYLHKGTMRDFHPTKDNQPAPKTQEMTFEQWQRSQKTKTLP